MVRVTVTWLQTGEVSDDIQDEILGDIHHTFGEDIEDGAIKDVEVKMEEVTA